MSRPVPKPPRRDPNFRRLIKQMNTQMPEMPQTAGEEQPKPTGGMRAWAEADGTFWGTQSSHDAIPPGIYRMSMEPNRGEVFLRQHNDTDALIALPDSGSEEVLAEIDEFKGLRPKFREYGFLYKRGILLWGPPGSGKTCTLQLAMRSMIETHNAIGVLVDHPGVAASCLQTLRRIEPERQIVALMEDLDALCEQYDESAYLSLLDGESQVDNIIFIATTNYPEKLDKRFTDRPSRFDTVRYVGMPSANARRLYLVTKSPQLDAGTVEAMVRVSEGYSIAHLRELVILTQCFGKTVEDAAKRIGSGRAARPSSDSAPDRTQFGFGT
jgi:hypothetical protein